MSSLCEKVKLQNGQFKSLKLIFCKFKGQFEREDQGQGDQFVTGQCLFNVPDVTLVPNFGRILVASCYLTLV